MENKKRLHHIESIRAIAALAVAVFHFSNYYSGDFFLVKNESIRHFFTFGAQGVELFYVISGFIIPYSLYKGRYKIKHYFHYLGKRLSRLLPPYYVTIILITLLGYYLTTYVWLGGYNVQWRNIAANGLFAVDLINGFDGLAAYFPDNNWINPIFETLKVEFQFYLLIGILFPLINKRAIYFIGVAVIMLGIGIYTIPESTVFVNAPYFLLGITTFYIFEKGWKWEYTAVLLLCVISLFFNYVTQDLVAGLLAVALILFLPQNFSFLKFTGKISYSYYLVHGLVGGNFLYFMRNTDFFQNYPILMVVFALLLSWIGAFLMYFCIEKPSLIISKRIKYKP